MIKSHLFGAAAIGLILAAGCAVAPAMTDAETVVDTAAAEAAVAAAIAAPERPEADTERDASRKPLETLTFAGLAPGMSVFEMEAGGGYYTEIISRTVGADGSVIMQNPAGFDQFIGDGYEKRLGGDRLANVTLTKTNFDVLDAEDGSVDLVTWVQGPHELWFHPEEGVSLGDPDAAFAEIARVLRPGGAFLAVDHWAPEDSGPETGGDTHRIAQAHVTEYAAKAGLVYEASSDALTRPDDDLTVNVFDPAVRGKTSQFITLYRKPAE